MKRASNKEKRRREAEIRNEYWAKLTPSEKLRQLDNRLGTDVGATRQRKKIKDQMLKENSNG